MSLPPKILVFDSGLGGLTVLREVVKARPEAHYTYVADDAFFPYGHHSRGRNRHPRGAAGRRIDRRAPARPRGDRLQHHVGFGDGALRAAYTVPFVGTVPAIKPACAATRTKRCRCSAPRATVKREYTQALIRDHGQGCEVTLVGSPDLASLAEAALSGTVIGDAAISAELTPCFVGDADDLSARTDTVVLACTHYPLLLDRFVRLAPWPVNWIDPAPAIARRVVDLLGPASGEAELLGAEMIFTSGRPHTLSRALMPFFGGRVPA